MDFCLYPYIKQRIFFGKTEIQRVVEALEQVKVRFIKEFNPSKADQVKLEKKVAELQDDISKIRKSWLAPLLIGLLLSMVVPTQPTQEKVKSFIILSMQRIAEAVVVPPVIGQ